MIFFDVGFSELVSTDARAQASEPVPRLWVRPMIGGDGVRVGSASTNRHTSSYPITPRELPCP